MSDSGSNWQSRTLGTLATTTSGGTPSRKRKDYYGGSIPWVKSGELNDDFIFDTEEHITEAGLKNSSAKLFPSGTVLIALYGATVGKTSILRTDASTNQAVCGITPGPDLDAGYLRYYLISLRQELLSHRYGGAQPNISQQIVRNQKIAYPPLPEQKKIAHILSTVQRAIEAQERIIQTTTELKKALMHKLFTEGLRNEPQKQTEIGHVPESWELLSIGDLFETQLGKMLSQKAKVGDSPKAYLRNKNVQWGRIDTDDLLRMDFNDREAEKFQLRKGDLLICEGGEVGRAALWDGSITDCYYQKALHRLRPKTDRITNEFMVHWMMFAFHLTNTYGVTGTRTTIAHLPEIKLKPLLVPVPSPDEQAEIVRALETVDQKHAVHQGKLGALRDLFRTLLHELMTAKTRVHRLEISS
jgi:type I restriction enzyme S subunit